MHRIRAAAFTAVLAVLVLALAACGVDIGSVPTLTPDPALDATAAALFPTPIPTAAPTATPVAAGDAAERIAALLSDIETAVITKLNQQYLDMVDLSDPVFAAEHGRWVEDWNMVGLVSNYTLTVRNLTIDGATATGDLTLAWTVFQEQVSRGADYPVLFRLGDDGTWRYAGIAWAPAATADNFRVLAMPGLEPFAAAALAMLPDVYATVTDALGVTPAGDLTLKLYDNPWVLSAMTRLSLTTETADWTGPGESIKLVIGPEQPLDEVRLARLVAERVIYAALGETWGEAPWWVVRGAAEYVSGEYWTLSDHNRAISQVLDWQRTSGLAAWDDLARRETTAPTLRPYAVTQGYAFIRFLTETYGAAARNAWLAAMAEDDLATATLTAFETSFEALNLDFLTWLDAQAG